MGIFPESLLVFLGLTVILFGGAAFMMGQAIADTWRPAWQNLPYGLLMAAGCRFLTFGLFGAPLLSVGGYIASVVVILALAFVAWRMARARRMVAQYPWLYDTDGPFGWKEKGGAA
jgi:hypothetical protein